MTLFKHISLRLFVAFITCNTAISNASTPTPNAPAQANVPVVHIHNTVQPSDSTWRSLLYNPKVMLGAASSLIATIGVIKAYKEWTRLKRVEEKVNELQRTMNERFTQVDHSIAAVKNDTGAIRKIANTTQLSILGLTNDFRGMREMQERCQNGLIHLSQDVGDIQHKVTAMHSVVCTEPLQGRSASRSRTHSKSFRMVSPPATTEHEMSSASSSSSSPVDTRRVPVLQGNFPRKLETSPSAQTTTKQRTGATPTQGLFAQMFRFTHSPVGTSLHLIASRKNSGSSDGSC